MAATAAEEGCTCAAREKANGKESDTRVISAVESLRLRKYRSSLPVNGRKGSGPSRKLARGRRQRKRI